MARVLTALQIASATMALAAVLGACTRKSPEQIAQERYAQAEMTYLTNSDISEVERALTNHLRTLDQEQENGVQGIDFDVARAVRHDELLLIYRKLRDTNKMELEFQQCLYWHNRYFRRAGLPVLTNSTSEAFAAHFDEGERKGGAHIKWKDR